MSRAALLLLLLGALLIGGPPDIARAQNSPITCEHCTQRLELSAEQWSCLRRRLPSLQSQSTPIVLFTLTDNACGRAQASNQVRGSGVQIPRSTVQARAHPGAQVYRLTRSQLACLANAASTFASDQPVEFNFSERC